MEIRVKIWRIDFEIIACQEPEVVFRNSDQTYDFS